MFLSNQQISELFHSLESDEDAEGKTALERTSSLFRFLSHDSLCRKLSCDSFSTPSSHSEPNYINRAKLTDEYERWGAITKDDGTKITISKFGKLDLRRAPKDKIGNDFLTAQVKQAQDTADGKPYPARPAPLLFLHGQDKPWEISKDKQWKENLGKFINSDTETTKIVQFLFRKFPNCDDIGELNSYIREAFTAELSDYLSAKLRKDDLLECGSPSLPSDRILIENASAVVEPISSVSLPSNTTLAGLIELISKNFLIFTGLSGSGKSRAASQIAKSFSTETSHYHFAAVGPDWNNRDPLLGYPDGIHATVYQTTPVLELLIRANAVENQNKPHFLILDEMNLSHVERYFADFLSAMESGEEISLYEGAQRGDIRKTISIPPNFFVIGTVNIDETTYQFSPKVLDRANVIEFRMEKGAVGKFFDRSTDEMEAGALAGIAEQFVNDAKTEDEDAVAWAGGREGFREEMEALFNVLQNFNAEFGYRTLKESSRYLFFHDKYPGKKPDGSDKSEEEKYTEAMDHIIIQKLLPKLHGSRSKLEGILRALLYFCESTEREDLPRLKEAALKASAETNTSLDMLGKDIDGHYKLSHDKLRRMCRKLHQDQFVSFADA
jgi:MoxR-like ATPase